MQYDDEAIPTGALRCAECGKLAEPGAEGWKAYLDDDDRAVMFCPECAARGFGEG